MDNNFYYLDQVIKQNTNDEKFTPFNKKLKSNLPIIYIVCQFILDFSYHM